MKVSANVNTPVQTQSNAPIKTLFTEKISKEEAQELKAQVMKNANDFAFNATSIQSNFSSSKNDFAKDFGDFQSFLSDIGYSGKPIASLSKEEAAELVSDDGIFGVKQTSDRVADFVINGSGGDEKLLRAGREGMLQGFKEAEKMWGGKLPEISQITMQKAIEKVDMAMSDLGFSIIDKEV